MPPQALIDSLNGIRRKVKTLSVAFGVGIVLATGVGLLLATVLLDYLLKLPVVPRLLVLLAALGALGYAAIKWVIRPVLARISLGDIAGHLETVFPQFDDRLRSTVDFVHQELPGSEMMKQRTVSQAANIAQTVDLSKALVTKPVVYSIGSAIGALAVLIALIALLPDLARIARERLFLANTAWPKNTEIVVDPLPKRVPVGQRIDLSLALKKGKPGQKATIYYQYDDGAVIKEFMIRGENGKYTASLDARGDKMKVWMVSGDDETEKQVIQVVPRLAIGRVEAVIAPPAYAEMPPSTVNLAAGPGYMTHGSGVKLSITFNKELEQAKGVKIAVVNNENAPTNKPAFEPKVEWSFPNPNVALAAWSATDSFRFRIYATDKDGFTNTGLEEYEVVVKPDQLPTVMIESPRKNVERTPDAYLPLQILAEDDFGIASLKLIVDKIGAAAPDPTKPAPANPNEKKHWEIDLSNWSKIDGTGERQRFRLNRDWELKQTLGTLVPGDLLEYYIEVKDNYKIETTENGKQVLQYHPAQYSSKLRITIISQEQAVIANIDRIRADAQKARVVQNTQNTNLRETTNLAQDTKEKPEMSKGDKAALEGITNRQSALVTQAKSLAQELEDVQRDLKENRVNDPELNDIAKEAKNDLNQAAEKPMTDAAQQLNQAQQSKANPANPQQSEQAKQNRNQAMEQAQQNQQQASKKIQDAIEKMDKVGNLSTAIKKVQEILDKQKDLNKQLKDIAKEELGKKPSEMKPENKDKLDKVAKEQKDLADQTDKAMKEIDKMGDQMQKSDPKAAEAMKEATQTAQRQQVSPQQRKASEQAQQNQQAGAQQAQQQAELGLEQVLNTLKDAERRKLEQLAKLLDEAIKAIQDLVRRQAGHNLDNLGLQGGDAMAKALKEEEIADLMAKANPNDPKGKRPKIELAVLTSGQEQTERNTRSVAKSFEEMPEGAAASGDLVRAAGKMGYAIVDLRDKKLSAAYNPHQVEALAALENALKKAEEEKKKVQEKIEQKQKEAIKAQFEKIRDEQVEKVNTPTTAIDKSRNPDKSLSRENAVRLNQLPGIQGDLSKRVGELNEELQKLGGIIYVWAGKDIVSSMDEVKDDLGKQKTGQPTQLEEARIVEQLNAMIDSLKQEKDQSEFAQKPNGGGGGGGGGGGSKLPTEAELRLLKALQLAINKNTTKTNELPKDQQDKVALVNLGNRQGQLRNLLDQLLKQATRGKEGLKPEPDPKDKLPEEAGKEAIENQEAQDELLGGKPNAEKETKQLNRVGDRMARSRQRLALDNDPGKLTQEIQKRIVVDLDDMIKQAQQQQASNSQPKPGQGQPKPGEGQQPGQQQANGQGQNSQPNNASSPAQNSTVSGGGSRNADLSAKINETSKEWGAISPRLRDAVIEGASEQVIEKYRKLVEDYYRGVSTGGKQ